MATDGGGKRDFNVDSPRTKVAMKMTGVTAKELNPKAQSAYEIPDLLEANKDLNDSRYKTFEKKRQQLVKNVCEAAHVLSPDVLSKSTNSFFAMTSVSDCGSDEMNKLMEKETEKIEKLKQQAKHDITKMVQEDLTAKKRVQESQVRQQESAARMAALKKEKAQGMAEARKQAEKANERKAQIREQAIKRRAEECEVLTQKLTAAGERATAQLAENMKVWDVKKEERAQKSALILDRKEKYMDNMQKRLEQDYYSQMGRDRILEDKMEAAEEKRRIMAEERSAKYTKNRLQVQHAQSEQQTARENAFMQSTEKFNLIQEAGAVALKGRMKELKDRNDKAKNKHAKNYERVVEENVKIAREMENKISKSASDVAMAKAEREKTALERRKESRNIMSELVLENRERIKRADEYKRSQSLAQIQGVRGRVESMLDTRRRIAEKRITTVKECFLEKHHLTETISQLRDAPAWKYNKLLRTLDLESLSTDKKPAENEENA